MFKKQQQPYIPIFGVNKEDIDKLFSIIRTGNISEINNYVSKNNNNYNVVDHNGNTPIHIILESDMSKRNKIKLIYYFLKNNIFINKKSRNNLSELHLACKYQYSDIVILLLLYGANARSEDNNKMTPLHYAVQGNIVNCKHKKTVDGLIPKVYNNNKNVDNIKGLIDKMNEITDFQNTLKNIYDIFLQYVIDEEQKYKEFYSNKYVEILEDYYLSENEKKDKMITIVRELIEEIKKDLDLNFSNFLQPMDIKEYPDENYPFDKKIEGLNLFPPDEIKDFQDYIEKLLSNLNKLRMLNNNFKENINDLDDDFYSKKEYELENIFYYNKDIKIPENKSIVFINYLINKRIQRINNFINLNELNKDTINKTIFNYNNITNIAMNVDQIKNSLVFLRYIINNIRKKNLDLMSKVKYLDIIFDLKPNFKKKVNDKIERKLKNYKIFNDFFRKFCLLKQINRLELFKYNLVKDIQLLFLYYLQNKNIKYYKEELNGIEQIINNRQIIDINKIIKILEIYNNKDIYNYNDLRNKEDMKEYFKESQIIITTLKEIYLLNICDIINNIYDNNINNNDIEKDLEKYKKLLEFYNKQEEDVETFIKEKEIEEKEKDNGENDLFILDDNYKILDNIDYNTMYEKLKSFVGILNTIIEYNQEKDEKKKYIRIKELPDKLEEFKNKKKEKPELLEKKGYISKSKYYILSKNIIQNEIMKEIDHDDIKSSKKYLIERLYLIDSIMIKYGKNIIHDISVEAAKIIEKEGGDTDFKHVDKYSNLLKNFHTNLDFTLNCSKIIKEVMDDIENKKVDYKTLYKSTITLQDSDEIEENKDISNFEDYIFSINYEDNLDSKKECMVIDEKIIDYLLQQKNNEVYSDVNQKDVYGNSPIFYAINNLKINIVKKLIEYRANLKLENKLGYTPLRNAINLLNTHNNFIVLDYYKKNDEKDNKKSINIIKNFCKYFTDQIKKEINNNDIFKYDYIHFLDNILPMFLIMYNQILYKKCATFANEWTNNDHQSLYSFLNKKEDDFKFFPKDLDKIVSNDENLHVLNYYYNRQKKENKQTKKKIKKLNIQLKELEEKKKYVSDEIKNKINIKIKELKKKVSFKFDFTIEKDNKRKDLKSKIKKIKKDIDFFNKEIRDIYNDIYNNIILDDIDKKKDWRIYNKLWDNYINNDDYDYTLIHILIINEIHNMLSSNNFDNIGILTTFYDKICKELVEDYEFRPKNSLEKNYVLNEFYNICKHIIYHIITQTLKYTIIKFLYKYFSVNFSDDDNINFIKKIIKEIEFQNMNDEIVKNVLKIKKEESHSYDKTVDTILFDHIFIPITHNEHIVVDDENKFVEYLEHNIIPYYKILYNNSIIQMKNLFEKYNGYIINESKYIEIISLLNKSL